jgi:DNA (cytosine-5)-methyltransferase 1
MAAETGGTVNVLSLFSGIGGLDLGLEWAGMITVGQVEIDPFCQRVLAKHWPEVPRHGDVRTCVEWWRSEPRPAVDVVAGGPPCQPFSLAGKGLAEQDQRYLWDPMRDVVDAIRSTWVVAENVPGLRTRGLATVLHDLAGLGYRARTGVVSACALGAPHTRERLFVLAHADGQGCRTWRSVRGSGNSQDGGGSRHIAERRYWWTSEPDVGRVAYGVPRRVDRIRALGNAVVPQVAEHIGRLIMTAEHGSSRRNNSGR